MHDWSDETVDWDGINNAARFIHDYCVRWARLGGQYKEKYGTVRFYANFCQLSLHGLIYPSHYFSRFPKWLFRLDVYYIYPVLNFFFGKIFTKWQKFIYARAYRKAIKKWPHLEEEITCCMDYPELIGLKWE